MYGGGGFCFVAVKDGFNISLIRSWQSGIKANMINLWKIDRGESRLIGFMARKELQWYYSTYWYEIWRGARSNISGMLGSRELTGDVPERGRM